MTAPTLTHESGSHNRTLHLNNNNKQQRSKKIIITLYTKPACVQCDATKKHLKAKDLPFTEVSLTGSAEALATVKSLGYLQAPVITVSTGDTLLEHWSGYRPDLIDKITP